MLWISMIRGMDQANEIATVEHKLWSENIDAGINWFIFTIEKIIYLARASGANPDGFHRTE